jgi:hypothetical protein
MTKHKICFSILVWFAICNGVASGATTLEAVLPKALPGGWGLVEGPRLYTRKTLFERINGQAELYFKYGYQKSVFAMYQHRTKPESQIEVDLYDMGSVLQAFGIFSRFRVGDRPGGMGLDSYMDESSILFYKGRYFVMLYAVESDPAMLKESAQAVSLRITDSSVPPKEIGFFPVQGLKPGSIQYFSEGLLGHQFLKRGFMGTYIEEDKEKAKVEAEVKGKAKIEGGEKPGNLSGTKNEVENKAKITGEDKPDKGQGEYNLFLAMFKDGEETRKALNAYRGYLTQRGRIESTIPAGPGQSMIKGEDPYKGRLLVTQKNPYLIGIAGFKREETALEKLREMMQRIK